MICNRAFYLFGGCEGAQSNGGQIIADLMARLYRSVLIVGGLAVLLYLAWGGISWITAGGDKAKVEQAKARITDAVMGIAFLVAVVAIVSLLSWALGYDFLNPTLGF
jgi:hypothetical protein